MRGSQPQGARLGDTQSLVFYYRNESQWILKCSATYVVFLSSSTMLLFLQVEADLTSLVLVVYVTESVSELECMLCDHGMLHLLLFFASPHCSNFSLGATRAEALEQPCS